jgi:hypothetical protein
MHWLHPTLKLKHIMQALPTVHIPIEVQESATHKQNDQCTGKHRGGPA